MTIFWVKRSILKFFANWPKFFSSPVQKIIFFNIVIFVATKKGGQQVFFAPFPFVAVFGSGIRDNIPNPQHCYYHNAY